LEFQLTNVELIQRFAAALAIGLLIGFERGWSKREQEAGDRIAGIRTFALSALLGALMGYLAQSWGVWAFGAGALSFGALIAVGQWLKYEERESLGLTTAVAALLTFALGAAAIIAPLALVASLAVITAFLLSVKVESHALLDRINRIELFATLRLLLVSVVVLPVLPNQGYGPWEALNPFQIWLLVVLILAISYTGYFAVRIAGAERGLLMNGLLGGLASSTAVAVNYGRFARSNPALEPVLAAGAAGAAGVMFPRLAVVAAIASPVLAQSVMWPLAASGAVACSLAALMAWRAPSTEGDKPTKAHLPDNPVNLMSAVKFGLFLTALMLGGRALKVWLGDAGVLALAGASGLADVDAVTLTIGSMRAGDEVGGQVAAAAVLLAAGVNTAIKPILIGIAGSWRLAVRVVLPLAGGLAAGAGVIAAQAFL